MEVRLKQGDQVVEKLTVFGDRIYWKSFVGLFFGRN
jgi:hypothetical protein